MNLLQAEHESLKWLMNFRNATGQVAMSIERLQEYGVNTKQRPGKCHHNAYALSKRPCLEDCRHCRGAKGKHTEGNMELVHLTGVVDNDCVLKPEYLCIDLYK